MSALHVTFCKNSALDNALNMPQFIWTEYDSKKVGKELIAASQGFDFVFCMTDGGLQLNREEISQLPKIIQFTQDAYARIPENMLLLGGTMLFSNVENANQVASLGHRSGFLASSVDYSFYRPAGEEREIPVAFIGSNLHRKYPLSMLREELYDYLLFNEYRIHGNGWKETSYIEPTQEPSVYSNSKIGINLSHFDYERYSSDRIYKIMGCGAMCLSHYYKGIEQDFEIGKHLDVWHNMEELNEKIGYYLSNETERASIAKAGMNHVRENHTWEKRVEQLQKYL